MTIRRRRECGKCGRRFTTYEVVERLPLMVVKRDGRREPFSRDKLLTGIIRSCDKRDISMEQITNFVAEIEHEIRNRTEPEVPSEKVGEIRTTAPPGMLPAPPQACQGSSRATPVEAKSFTLRVTRVMPWTRAVAAMYMSRSGRG